MILKHCIRSVLGASMLLVAGIACGTPASPATMVEASTPGAVPTSGQAETAAVPTLPAAAVTPMPAAMDAPAQPERIFKVAVIVDLGSEAVGHDQAQAVVSEAGTFLQQLAGIGMVMTDLVEDGGGGSTNDMASRYIGSHAGAEPNGLVIFSFGDGGRAKLNGGYGYAISGPPGFRNAFVSAMTGNDQIYVAVVHFSHRYAACGYGGSEAVQSSTALAGECGNRPGAACVQFNGYSMCADSVGHLYASTPTHYVSSAVIHELLHSFSAGGEADHYDTPECNTRMGYPEQYHDLQEAQYHNDLCPYVYDEFGGSFQP